MEFWFSGEIDHRVNDLFSPVQNRVEARLNAICRDRQYGDAIIKIAIIPMVLGPEFLVGRPERRLFQRKQRSADYRTIIDFEAFRNGDEELRKRLLIENTLDAIRDLQRKAGASFLGNELISDIVTEFRYSPPEINDTAPNPNAERAATITSPNPLSQNVSQK